MVLFARWPSLSTRRAEKKSWPPFPEEKKADYPALRERFAVADRVVLPRFIEQDRLALAEQNRHRLIRVLLVLGGMATSVLGAVQIALEGQTWPPIALALVGFGVAVFTALSRSDPARVRYLEARARAEELRSLYFRFLSGISDKGGQPCDEVWLESAVALVCCRPCARSAVPSGETGG